MSIKSQKLFGHFEIIKHIKKLYHGKTLPHGLIFFGPKGIGKATLARHIATYILNPVKYENTTSYYDPVIFEGNNPDCKIISQDTNNDKDILIDDIRTGIRIFSQTSANNNWRICIIDSIDSISINSANLLLKTLEEPPTNSLLILISHNIDIVPATIISRCQLIKFFPLSSENKELIVKNNTKEKSEFYNILSKELSITPGIYQSIEKLGGNQFYQAFLSIIEQISNNDLRNIQEFGESYIFNKNNKYPTNLLWSSFCEFFQLWSYHNITSVFTNKITEPYIKKIFHGHSPQKIVKSWFSIGKIMDDSKIFNLDKKHTLSVILSMYKLGEIS